MAEQIIVQHSASGATLYALVWGSGGTVWSTVTATFVVYVSANLADYVIPLAELETTAIYQGDSLSIEDDVRRAFVYEQLGASPAVGDTLITVVDLFNLPLILAGLSALGASQNAELLQQMLSVLSRSDAGVANDFTTALNKLNEDGGSGPGTYDNTTDSLEAIALAGGGMVDANVVEISGSAVAADKLEAHAGAVAMVVIGTGSSTTSIVLGSVDGGVPPSQSDTFNNRVLVITSGALNRQAVAISDYDGSTGTLTVTALTGSPVNGVAGVIV